MIRVLVVDDHTLVRTGICKLLEAEADLQVVGQTGSGHEAVALARDLKPDIVLLDYRLGDMDGIEATDQLKGLKGNLRVVVLTMIDNEEVAIRVLRAGASGFVVKGASPEELLSAIRKVAARGTYVSPTVQEKVVDRLGQPPEKIPESVLSDRELQVLVRLGRGLRTREVAAELCLSLSTVETYRARILNKLRLRNNADLARFAIKRGLIDPDEGTPTSEG